MQKKRIRDFMRHHILIETLSKVEMMDLESYNTYHIWNNGIQDLSFVTESLK